jgi:hypothetical protein
MTAELQLEVSRFGGIKILCNWVTCLTEAITYLAGAARWQINVGRAALSMSSEKLTAMYPRSAGRTEPWEPVTTPSSFTADLR